MATLIGVYRADAGVLADLRRRIGRLIGSHACWLSQLTHSPSKPTEQWRALESAIQDEFGHTFSLTYRNRRTPEQEAASSGREPCLLIDDGEGHLSMIVDWNDLELAHGDVARFERILRSKLLMY
ncbi:MAG: hypothetical protein HOL65_05965 [Microbacteriaceae bacterium]|jgi:hypothetical protein|nr:hypothetical protein [Microbacteriaceae bacterium]MBT5248319.1 hypothetical protein [Microbacteriaceae bacterium]MBT5616973.1 hypothetical protein [Microbacteriaceae bacterium]MBT5730051.1 hypothetical protein [Microbacteriaceae bacterium]